jgi:hypothetical protein
MMMNQTHSDPVIDEIRDIRHTTSARFDHDPERLVEYYMEMQERYRDRLIQSAPAAEQADSSAP